MFVLPLNIKTLSGEKLPAFNPHSISRIYTHDKLNKHFYYTKREFPFPFPNANGFQSLICTLKLFCQLFL